MENNNTLAKVALAINVVLIILVIILFTRSNETTPITGSNPSDQNDSVTVDYTSSKAVSNINLKFAIFNMDSLNSKSKLFSKIEDQIKEAGVTAERKMRGKQKEIDDWKSKWEKKGKLLSHEEAQYYKEAEKMQADAVRFEQNVQMKLGKEQEELMQTYALRISNYSADFAKSNGYSAIFSYQFGQSPWFYDTSMDVTNELVRVMNDSFISDPEEDSDEE